MKANSDHHPTSFTKARGKIYFNYNIIESEKTDEYEIRTVFDYDYVEVENTEKDFLIRAIIRDKFTIDDEIALINNKSRGRQEDIEAYNSYQLYRTEVKIIVNELKLN